MPPPPRKGTGPPGSVGLQVLVTIGGGGQVEVFVVPVDLSVEPVQDTISDIIIVSYTLVSMWTCR